MLKEFLSNQPGGPIENIQLFYQVIILPPIIYECSLTISKNRKVFERIGSLLFS
jgi:hypothetical protein